MNNDDNDPLKTAHNSFLEMMEFMTLLPLRLLFVMPIRMILAIGKALKQESGRDGPHQGSDNGRNLN